MSDEYERHPGWITRLRTEDYAPVALVRITELAVEDIVNVRDLGLAIDVRDDNAFLTIKQIERDDSGMHGFSGKLPDGSGINVVRGDGVPMRRRRVVRYVRHAPI